MRFAAGLLFLSVLTLTPGVAAADDAYPSRPVTLVHGFAAGGNADTMSRIMADQMLSEIEGIIPALESAHAVAYAAKIAPRMAADEVLIVNLSGRGDKDVSQAAQKIGLSEKTP